MNLECFNKSIPVIKAHEQLLVFGPGKANSQRFKNLLECSVVQGFCVNDNPVKVENNRLSLKAVC